MEVVSVIFLESKVASARGQIRVTASREVSLI
jgi:hypothetical protein